jgi:hypothetical protein
MLPLVGVYIIRQDVMVWKSASLDRHAGQSCDGQRTGGGARGYSVSDGVSDEGPVRWRSCSIRSAMRFSLPRLVGK